jgi:HK97 family phage portal protein
VSVLDSIRRGLGLTDAKAQSVDYGEFNSWFSPRNIFSALGAGELASSETVFAAVSKLGNSMGSLPLVLHNSSYERQNTRLGEMLMYQPNANMHRSEFIRTMEVNRNTYGNAYAMKEYGDRGQIEGLRILDPTRVAPAIEGGSGELWYGIEGDQGRYFVHNADVIHVKHIYAGVGYVGISPLDVLADTISFDDKVKQFSLDQVESSVRASFILQMATMLDDDRKAAMVDSFRSFYAENGGVLIQEQGTTITPIEQKFLDTKVFEVEKITRARVATVFGLPLHALGETEGISYNSREQAALEYVQDTIVPIAAQYESEFDRKLVTPTERSNGLHFKFNVNALLRGDMNTRMDFYFKGVRTGIFTPNECRAWEELSPYADGDRAYMSRDLSPVGEPRE